MSPLKTKLAGVCAVHGNKKDAARRRTVEEGDSVYSEWRMGNEEVGRGGGYMITERASECGCSRDH